jgi:hypothetical protein
MIRRDRSSDRPGKENDLTYPYGSPQYPDPNSGGYPQYPYGYPHQMPPRTNGLAVASMVLSLVGVVLLCAWGAGGVPALLGVIFGHIAKGQIRREGSQGDGMAMAGLIIGYCVLGLAALVVVLVVVGVLSLFSLTHAGSI